MPQILSIPTHIDNISMSNKENAPAIKFKMGVNDTLEYISFFIDESD